MKYQYSDGGRSASGYRGICRDCVVRAISIALVEPYERVYRDLYYIAGSLSPRKGVRPEVYKRYLSERGWVWHPCMGFGTGCRIHLRASELPSGRIICRLSRHLVAVIDGVVFDISDPRRGGNRCVYGYWQRGDI